MRWDTLKDGGLEAKRAALNWGAHFHATVFLAHGLQGFCCEPLLDITGRLQERSNDHGVFTVIFGLPEQLA